MVAADLTVATLTEAGAHRTPASVPVRPSLPAAVDVAVIGGGCSGTAIAVRLAALPGQRDVLVLEGRAGDDPRSWCSWDDGTDPLPEARSASWDRWQVRSDRGVSTGTDPEHPYVLVRAADRRAAAETRLGAAGAAGAAGAVRVVRGAPVSAVSPLDADAGVLVRSAAGTVRAGTVLDARGPRCPGHVASGRVLLHQRFVGQWITTRTPVFDPSTVTLMDFVGQRQDGRVAFVYVLPVSTTSALVESTVFTPDEADPFDHRTAITEYVRDRWGLDGATWSVVEEESGCIPMTDAPATSLTAPSLSPAAAGAAAAGAAAAGTATAAVVGTTRPSSGYGFARSNRHSTTVARALADGTVVPPFRDGRRTAFLDAVFLRFLRDRPGDAPEAFRRLFGLPGPLVVRFLSERSSLLDDLRIVFALPKVPFLVALALMLVERRPRLGARRGAPGRRPGRRRQQGASS